MRRGHRREPSALPRHNMNYRILARILGIITAALSMAFVLCLCLSFYFAGSDPAENVAVQGFARSTIVAVALTVLLELFGLRSRKRLFGKEALASIGLSWILATLVGALPYIFIMPGIGFADAVFESASGFTTTGASVFPVVEKLPRSLLFWRSLSQWIGGLGVIVFFVAILSFLGAGAKLLFSNESSAQAADLGSERVQTGVWRIVRLYLLLSLLCTLAFHVAGMSLYDAVNHMCTVLSTGGFSTHTASVAWFHSPLIEWLVILFMAIGGTSFVLLLKIRYGDSHILRSNTEFKAYYAILALATLVCVVFNAMQTGHRPGLAETHDIVRDSAFAVVSVMTTTGYATKDWNLWLPVLHSVLLLLMVIGGCTGSTGGGVKVLRFVTTLRYARQLIERSYRSNVVRSIRVNARPVSPQDCEESNGFLLLMALIVCLGMILMAMFEPHMSLEGSISATLACVFNVGPGLAEVGPTHCYQDLHIVTKYMLSLLMILGRVELFAVLVLFSPSIWRKY